MQSDVSTYFNSDLEKEKKIQRLIKLRKRRTSIILIILTLLILSSINMISSAFYMKPENIKKHLIFIFIFLIVFTFIGNINRIFKMNFISSGYKLFSNRKINITIFFTSMLILYGMIIGIKMGFKFIPKINGTYGWINFGSFSIQPAEILKCAFVINIANILSRAEDRDFDDWLIVINTFIYLCLYGIPILLQGDLGSVVHYFSIWLFMICVTKLRSSWIKTGFITLIAIGIAGITYIYKFVSVETASYRSMRIKHYIDGLFFGKYSDDYGYQIKQSIYAFGSGGFLGKGYANGVQKYTYLPEIHTDFIMATFGEEFGMIGILLIVGLFFILYYLCIITARDCKNYFGKFLAIGLGALIISQVLINIFVVIGLLPVFGIPMPFFSYGGSSMLSMAVALGIIYNINIE